LNSLGETGGKSARIPIGTLRLDEESIRWSLNRHGEASDLPHPEKKRSLEAI
jgi:hypothetical protein